MVFKDFVVLKFKQIKIISLGIRSLARNSQNFFDLKKPLVTAFKKHNSAGRVKNSLKINGTRTLSEL